MTTLDEASTGEQQSASRVLDLSTLPQIFVSSTHLPANDLHKLEEDLVEAQACLTYNIREARIVLSKASKKARVLLDLRSAGVWTKEVIPESDETVFEDRKFKRQKVDEPIKRAHDEAADSSTASEGGGSHQDRARKSPSNTIDLRTPSPEAQSRHDMIRVVRLSWFEQSVMTGAILPLQDFMIYQGRPVERPASQSAQPSSRIQSIKSGIPDAREANKISPRTEDILYRAKEDAPSGPSTDRYGKRKFAHSSRPASTAAWQPGHSSSRAQPAHLLATTTSEYDAGHSSDLPEPPDWVKQGIKYACQRSTPRWSPNREFIDLLEKVKLVRILTNDEIGVRAYSTSIASIAAYPYKLSHPKEIMMLPGCDAKIANLFVEWKNTGAIEAVREIEADENLTILGLFYNIWGVGALTAREFFFDKGWRDLDDIVEYGWSTLTRVQQIGVKYYDEFLDRIPRAEVEAIAKTIHQHGARVRDKHIESMLVGGYRRGKEACGDVDFLISHPDEAQTLNLVTDIVASLEEEGWITHTLLLSLNSTHRDQQTLSFRTGRGGHGFDTLDKALVVWQDPVWPGKDDDRAANPKAKNPNIHRRVDIIVAPWRAVGCAVVGWSGGTTFERDLRRYAKGAKGWKFDSSGIRSRVNGEVVDVEDFFGRKAQTMEEAERRVFESLGLEWREPDERCTG